MLDFSTREPAARPGKTCFFGAGSAGTKVMEEVLALAPQTSSVCAMNLDARLLNASSIPCKIHLGARITRGLGSGGDASVGAQAARESESAILRALEGCDLVVITAGLGGGTGSGVAPEVARLAKEQGAYVVSVVIRPFGFEGERRSVLADEALARLALYSDMVLRFDNDAMESLIDSDKGVLEAFSVVNALMARAVLIVPSLLDSSGSLLQVGLDDLLRVAGSGKGICSFGVGESSVNAPVEEILAQVQNSPLFLEKRLSAVDDVLVLVRGGAALTLQRLEMLVNGMAEMLGGSVRLHIGASVADGMDDRLALTVLGVVPAEKTVSSPVSSLKPETSAPAEQELVPEESLFVGAGKTIQASSPAAMPEPEPEQPVPSIKRNEHELEEELVPVRPVLPVPDIIPSPPENPLAEERYGMDEKPEEEPEAVPDIKELEEGAPPAEGEEERAGHGLFARVRPLILDGEDLDLPPALRKRKPDQN